MAQLSLYRKYRPGRFSEVAGQSAAVGLLASALVRGRLGQAYLFSGPRGCGKTTAARILAKAVNCERPGDDGEPCCECAACEAVAAGSHLDVMEIDAASNRGIDDIRALRENVSLSPLSGRTRVYILDEVHMLTDAAFNALLKTLEEPPPTAMFIMATTEPHKVPVTIRSRCQHIPFHRISSEDITARLRSVADAEGVPAEDAALWEIARGADGAMRDALSLAEQAISIGEGRIDADAVRALFGGGSRGELERFVSALRGDPAEAAALLKSSLDRGVTPERLLDTLFPILRDMWLFALWGERAFAAASMSDAERAFVREEAAHWTSDQLHRATRAVAALMPRARWGLRSEVFAGLLMLELTSARDGTQAQTQTAAQPRSQMPTRAEHQEPKQSAPLPMPTPQKQTQQSVQTQRRPLPNISRTLPTKAAQPTPAAQPAAGAALPERLASLDMHMAAALLDARVYESGGEMRFDLSNVSKLAATVLEMPRTRFLISRAFGVSAPEQVGREMETPMPPRAERPATAPAPSEIHASPPPKRQMPAVRNMSLDELSAFMGAEVLMRKPVDEVDVGGDVIDEEEA